MKDGQILKEIEKHTSISIESVSKPFKKSSWFVKFHTEEVKNKFCEEFSNRIPIKNRLCKIKEYKGRMDVFKPSGSNDKGQPSKKLKNGRDSDKPLLSLKEKICPNIDLPKEE
jgi:hypothetical protein